MYERLWDLIFNATNIIIYGIASVVMICRIAIPILVVILLVKLIKRTKKK